MPKTGNNDERIRYLAYLIGNKAIIKNIKKFKLNKPNSEIKIHSVDQKITDRIYKLLISTNLLEKKVLSPQIYNGICSRQNWHYRIVSSEKRLLTILYSLLDKIQKTNLSKSVLYLNIISKSLYTKTNRLNYSEGLRSLRLLEICAFLNFTTNFYN